LLSLIRRTPGVLESDSPSERESILQFGFINEVHVVPDVADKSMVPLIKHSGAEPSFGATHVPRPTFG